jgi:hypothetical protein
MRQLGDTYVHAEFRLLLPHNQAKTSKEGMSQSQLNAFHAEWSDYLDQMQTTARLQRQQQTFHDGDFNSAILNTQTTGKKKEVVGFGKDLPMDMQSNMTEEQLTNLEKLRQETSSKK